MSRFDMIDQRLGFLAGSCGNISVQCLDLTDQRLGFWQGVAATKCSMSVDLTDQRLGFWQGVAATKCSMSGFDRSTIRVLAGSCGNKMFNVWI